MDTFLQGYDIAMQGIWCDRHHRTSIPMQLCGHGSIKSPNLRVIDGGVILDTAIRESGVMMDTWRNTLSPCIFCGFNIYYNIIVLWCQILPLARFQIFPFWWGNFGHLTLITCKLMQTRLLMICMCLTLLLLMSSNDSKFHKCNAICVPKCPTYYFVGKFGPLTNLINSSLNLDIVPITGLGAYKGKSQFIVSLFSSSQLKLFLLAINFHKKVSQYTPPHPTLG